MKRLRNIILALCFLQVIVLLGAGQVQAATPTSAVMKQSTVTVYRGSRKKVETRVWSGKKRIRVSMKWTSSNPAVATVNAKASRSVTIKGKSNGTALITGTTSNGITVTCHVTVKTRPRKMRIGIVDKFRDVSYHQAVGGLHAAGASTSWINTTSINVNKYDGLCIPGGGDVNPRRYGQRNRHSTYVSDANDSLQLKVLDKFVKAGKPVIGFCRGIQVINVYFGGSLHQHVGGHYRYRTLVNEPGTIAYELYGPTVSVLHSHHQIINRLGNGLVVTQKDRSSGLIEGVTHESLPIWAAQWHPEISGSRAESSSTYS